MKIQTDAEKLAFVDRLWREDDLDMPVMIIVCRECGNYLRTQEIFGHAREHRTEALRRPAMMVSP